MAVQTDWSRRHALCDWLTANGIEPNLVLVDGDLTITDTEQGRAIRVEVCVVDENGRRPLDDRGQNIATEIRTVPLTVEPPAWFEPYEKPTREQLLTAVERVRKLHPSIPGEGDTLWCQVCSQEEIQPQPVGWWVPWPCPTVRALDGQEQR